MFPPGCEFAPAKVNLALHVTGRRADGHHLLDSIVVFPGTGDLIEAELASELSLTLGGPFGQALGTGADNLVLRAALLLRPKGCGASLRLIKRLPIASGIGGGSADAAATLRVLSRLWRVPLPQRAAMLGLGADVPVCLVGRSSRMRGIGEQLTPLALPPFWLVLANPGIAVATRAVFHGTHARDNAPLPEPPAFADVASLAAWLAEQRNDLTAAATALAPPIAEVQAALAAQPGCSLARMSGSGATCFGIFVSEVAALGAVAALNRARPEWWLAAGPVP